MAISSNVSKLVLIQRRVINPSFPLVQTGLFINNEFVAGADTLETINPSTGKVIANVQSGMTYKYPSFGQYVLPHLSIS